MPHTDHLPRRRSRRRCTASALSVCAAMLGVAALLAGCGGGTSPGVASVGNATASSSQSSAGGGGDGALGGGPAASSGSGSGGGQRASVAIAGGRQNELEFSACMRANGEPNFPDPNGQGVIQFGTANGIDPSSPQFQAAQQKCAKYTGGAHPPSPAQQAQAQAQALRFSACMRSHGEPKFPDPQFSNGGIGIRIHGGPGSALDPQSPVFQAAQKACSADLPGGGPLPAVSK